MFKNKKKGEFTLKYKLKKYQYWNTPHLNNKHLRDLTISCVSELIMFIA